MRAAFGGKTASNIKISCEELSFFDCADHTDQTDRAARHDSSGGGEQPTLASLRGAETN